MNLRGQLAITWRFTRPRAGGLRVLAHIEEPRIHGLNHPWVASICTQWNGGYAWLLDMRWFQPGDDSFRAGRADTLAAAMDDLRAAIHALFQPEHSA